MSPAPDPVLGRVLDGRYRIDAALATGGMATVYRAWDLRLDRAVAVKVMRADLARDEGFVSRFVHEARTAARLQHPHIVSVYDQGEDDGVVYLAMELVEGRTLRDVISQRAPLSTRQALALLTPVTEALAAAHAEGLVHRDIKPENVLLGDRNSNAVKVADFGLARLDGTPHTSETLWGTAAYLAPEQVETGVADARTDVYAVGLLFFELLTGQKAFPGSDPLRVAYEHVHGSMPHPRDVVDSVPEAVQDVVLTASATDPGDRVQDASVLLERMQALPGKLSAAELDAAPPPKAVWSEKTGEATEQIGTADDSPTEVVGIGTAGDATEQFPAPNSPASDSPVSDTQALPLAGASVAASGEGSYARTTGNAKPKPEKVEPPPKEKRRSGAAAWILGLLLVVLAAGGGFGYWYFAEGPGVHSPVPEVVGMNEVEARASLVTEDLEPVVDYSYSEEVAADTVINSDPEPGTELRHGSEVQLDVSQGPERYDVPRLEGMTREAAENALTEENLAVGEISEEFHDEVSEGEVISSDPEAGTPLPPDGPVNLTVSNGPEPVDVPDVTGRKQDAAVKAIEGAGLDAEVAPEEVFDEEVPEGSVVSQEPSSGTLRPGETVRITISKGPDLVEVPSVVGKQFNEAKDELEKLGLTVKRENIRGGFFRTVREQSVEPGEEVEKDTEIVLEVV